MENWLSKRKPDSSIEEHPNNKKVKKMKKIEFENSNQHGKKNFPGLNLMRGRKKCSALHATSMTVADKASWLYVGINGSSTTGFRHDLSCES